MNEYYFSNLNDIEQKCYKKIISAVRNKETNVNLGIFIGENIFENLLRAIDYDHPEFFYVDFKQVKYVKSTLGLIYYINYRIKIDLCDMVINSVQEEINKVKQLVIKQNFTTDYEKCRWIHNYLVKSVRYNFEAVSYPNNFPEAFEIDGVFKGKRAVCEGIAKAYKFLCDKLGVESLIAFGTATSEYFGQDLLHAWNIIKIENQFMHVDVTWDIGVSESSKYMRYDYFCISDMYLKKDHIFSNFPLCETDDWSYFYRKRRVFSGVKQLKGYLEEELKNKKNIFYFKIIWEKDIPSDIQDRIQNLIKKMVAQYYHCAFSIELIPNSEQMCFFYRIKGLGEK